MFTPQNVHENATPDANEVLVSGVDETGTPRNVLLRDHAALRAKLLATPAMIPNPERAKVEAEAFQAASDYIAAQEKAAADAAAEAARRAADAAAFAEAQAAAQ